MVQRSFENLLTLENPVFSSYAYWGAVLIIKCLLMSPYTSFFRYKNKAAASAEDLKWMKIMGDHGEYKLNANDPAVERVRRAHLNDLENILPHLFAGFFYVLTNPAVLTATLLFKVSAIARIVHTIVYAVVVIPQPARGTVWFVHYLITFYMAISVLLHCK